MQKVNYWSSLGFFLVLLAIVLLWRGGYLPDAVYHGPLRDTVLQRTGFDLADRASYEAPRLQIRDIQPAPGATPAIIVEFENVGKNPVREFQAVAAFRTSLLKGTRSHVTNVIGKGKSPVQPGERRKIRLESRAPYDPKAITGKPAAILADVYWGGPFNMDGTRREPRRDAPNDLERAARWHTAQPEILGIVVRR